MKNKNILITGGAGFIGSHIVDELIDNNNITIIDNFTTGNIKNLKNPKHENLEIIQKNLSNTNLDEVLEKTDYIFHLAAMASVPLSIKNPIECNDYNVNATIKLLKSAVNQNIKKIIFSSSSAIYGENTNTPLKETEYPMPTSPYAASKISCEMYLKSFYESYGLKYTALRYFNVFGPRQDKNSQYAAVIPNFISSILEKKQPIIYGDGTQTRDFVFVKDIVKANINACESNYNGALNIASGNAITINKLYEIVKNTLNADIQPKYLPPRPGDIEHSYADISNMKKINLKINTSNFKNQLIETANWFKNEFYKIA